MLFTNPLPLPINTRYYARREEICKANSGIRQLF